MEGSAVWIEDEVYDTAAGRTDLTDPNYSFLADSPLLQPEIPLDAYGSIDDGQDFEYGAFVFWRFLSEYGLTESSDATSVVKEIWQRAAGSTTALQATKAEVNQRATPFNFDDAWLDFEVYNRAYTAYYEEGAGYWSALGAFMPWDADFILADGGSTGSRAMSVSRLSTRFVFFFPQSMPANGDLQITVDPAVARNSTAMLFTTGGCVMPYYIDWNTGSVQVDFGSTADPQGCTGTVQSVALVLANSTSSTRTSNYSAQVVTA
jgi:hypothetical protein